MRSFVSTAATKKFRIGVVGYSAQLFDRNLAREKLEDLIKKADKYNEDNRDLSIVSGLTDIGIPAVAYQYADDNDLHTAGVACGLATNHHCYPVDREVIVGKDWGDESETFINEEIDCLIRLGGGNQSHNEVKMAKEAGLPVLEAELPSCKSYCLMGYLSKESAKELHKQAKTMSADDIKKPESYHITIRFWLKEDNENARKHIRKVKNYLKERFAYPVELQVSFDGDTDVFGDEKAYVLHVSSPVLTNLFEELDAKLQKLGAPPSDYDEYRPHITIGERVTKKPKLKKGNFIIDSWRLTECDSVFADSKVLWQTKAKIAHSAIHAVTAEERTSAFVNALSQARDIDEVLDYLIYKTPQHTTDAAVFDHILLTFFSQLPDFDQRRDVDELEIESFKHNFPYDHYGLNRLYMLRQLKNYRSINRIIDEIVDQLSDEVKEELARQHLKQFWFSKCNQDVTKFVTSLQPSYWLRSQ